MKISQLFSLNKSQYELDFIDIDPEMDWPLFVDPYYLGKCSLPWADDANRTVYNFFSALLTYFRSDQIERARLHFSHLNEPNETCLGFSKTRPSGRGIGSVDTSNIFESLSESKAIKTGLVEDLEDFRIFVNGIDKDKMSDMTTNIIRKHLIEYTKQQCVLWNIPLQNQVASGFSWNRHTNQWETEYTNMLVVNSRKILLVPKGIVSYSKEYTPSQYIQHFVLNFLQEEHLSLNSSLVQVKRNRRGEIVRRYVTKDSIKKDIGGISREYLEDFTARHPEVFREFKAKTKTKLRAIKNEELTDELLNEVIDHLIETLRGIEPGGDSANFYHRTITGILELLFYPCLTSPQVEVEINEGRKRIDITFDNSAETGFFFRLGESHGIPSRFIIIECKNYSRDLNNPELDQISGRFSPNRGKFGIIVCRTIEKIESFIKKCSDTCRDDRGIIIPLTDDDLIEMLSNYEKHGIGFCEQIIADRFRSVSLS